MKGLRARLRDELLDELCDVELCDGLRREWRVEAEAALVVRFGGGAQGGYKGGGSNVQTWPMRAGFAL